VPIKYCRTSDKTSLWAAKDDKVMTYTLGNKYFRNILFAVIIASGIALTILASIVSHYADEKLIQTQFNEAAEIRDSALKEELGNNLDVLTSVQALYYASKEVRRTEFQNFTKHILKRHTSIQALEWIPRVPDSRRQAYESAARREGFPAFRLTERNAQGKMKRAEKRKEYFPVYFVEPYKGNEAALGFDLASNPTRLEALDLARKTGEILATGRITLVQETKGQFGFIVFAPIYRKGAVIDSDRARADNLEGFALGVFRIGDIVEKATNYFKPGDIDFVVLDASASEKERPLYTHVSRTRKTPLPNNEQSETGLRLGKTLEVAGRKWMIIYSATPEFIAERKSRRSWDFLVAGLLFTGLVAGFLFITARHAEQVAKSVRELSDANATLAHEMMERKQVENKLMLFGNLIDRANDSIVVMDLETGHIMNVNDQTCKTLGYTRDELLNMTAFDIAAAAVPPDPSAWKAHVAEVRNKGHVMLEERQRRKDGTTVPVEVNINFISFEEGDYLVAIIRDITERRQSEETLRASEKRYRGLVENANDAVFTVSPDGIITSLNPVFERITGRSAREWIDRSFVPLVHPEELPKAMEALQDVLAGRSVPAYELRIAHASGEYRYVELTHSPQWLDGRVIGVLGIGRDITDRKQAEQKLKSFEKFIEDILTSVDEAFVVIDREYRIISANRAYCEQAGKSLEHIIGKYCYEISHHATHPCHEPGHVCACKSTFETGEPGLAVHTHTDEKGKQKVVEVRTYAMKDASGHIQSIIEVINDITEKRALENQLRHAQKMEGIGTLAGGIAHDFNNILSAIIGYGHLTLMKMPQDEPLRMNIEHMLESADRAASLTQSLLAFSRKQISDRKPVDLNTIIKKVEKFLIRVIGEDVAVHLTLVESELTIVADSGQLEQVFMNLATNARDAMPRGGSFLIETSCVEIDRGFISAHGYGKPGTYAMTSVTDTGVGMNEETKKKIFEPFFTTKEVGKGTGLGLAMVYGILKQNDGFINVYSEPGKGTTFRLYFPMIKAPAEEGQKAVEVPYPKGGTETILLAEDDVNLRSLSVVVLEQMGYTVITAGKRRRGSGEVHGEQRQNTIAPVRYYDAEEER